MSKKNNYSYKSNCCNADVRQQRTDKGDTSCVYYTVCTHCKKPCGVHINERQTWAINPKTRIVPNKKRLFTDKELRKLRSEEDF